VILAENGKYLRVTELPFRTIVAEKLRLKRTSRPGKSTEGAAQDCRHPDLI